MVTRAAAASQLAATPPGREWAGELSRPRRAVRHLVVRRRATRRGLETRAQFVPAAAPPLGPRLDERTARDVRPMVRFAERDQAPLDPSVAPRAPRSPRAARPRGRRVRPGVRRQAHRGTPRDPTGGPGLRGVHPGRRRRGLTPGRRLAPRVTRVIALSGRTVGNGRDAPGRMAPEWCGDGRARAHLQGAVDQSADDLSADDQSTDDLSGVGR